jgi:hypothetical protein
MICGCAECPYRPYYPYYTYSGNRSKAGALSIDQQESECPAASQNKKDAGFSASFFISMLSVCSLSR